MSDSDKPGGKLPLLAQEMRQASRRKHFLFNVLSLFLMPLGGKHLVARLTFRRDAGWYYFGNVGDARHYAARGPYFRKRKAWSRGLDCSRGIMFNKPFVLFLWQAPEQYFDVRQLW